ncbi:MAG: hypothetical protein H0Z18_11060 [Thermococcus sp.]|nr:hypothetical protein [Thermococcus sp.]
MISVWILDYEHNQLYRGFTVVNYNTKKVRMTGLRKTVKINVHELTSEPLPKDVTPLGSNRHFYIWRTDWSLSWRPTSYIEVPILIVKNKNSNGPTLSAWVDIVRNRYSRFDYTFGYGYKISQKDTPSLDIYSGQYYTIRKRLRFGDDMLIQPGKSGYIYIKAKPFHLHEKEYRCVGSLNRCTPTGYERIQEGIRGVKTSGSRIIGGARENSLPPYSVMSKIYYGTTFDYVGKLNVNEKIYLGELFNNEGSCTFSFGFGIPVGALAAAFGPVPLWASGLSVSFHYETSDSLEVYGGIKNRGANPWGHNKTVYFNTRISRYTYHSGTCNMKVPVGVYIEAKTSRWS